MPASILIVDDNKPTRDLLTRWLQRDGYAIATATGGQDAIDLVARQRFDLVLLDVQMPDLSGLEVLRTVREIHPPHVLPVVMVTGASASDEVVAALDLGANDYVTKPLDVPVLRARIRALLNRQQVDRASGDHDDRYALAILGSNDGLWDWNVETGELYLSPRWKGMLGFEDSELRNEPASWFDRVHPQDRPRVTLELENHLAGATPQFHSEHRVRDKSGSFRWVLARGVAMRNGAGRAVRLAGSLTDITAGKLADALTGIPNRLLFFDRLARVIERHRRFPEQRYAVLFLDLDQFRLVNDGLGHHVGDQLLIQAAERLERCLRSTDTVARLRPSEVWADGAPSGSTVARLGGDEFAIILDAMHEERDAAVVAERIQAAFALPFDVAGRSLFTSASIGIASSRGGYTNPGDVLRDADIAMYRAKAAGRGRWELFEGSMREQPMVRLQLDTELRHALEHGEFRLYYQPIVALHTRQVTGVEALLRWQHPQRGMVAPDVFLPFAEESGLIVPIGYWALAEACRQLREWRHHLPACQDLVMSVNMSPRQLLLADLAERMIEIVQRSAVPTTSIELEVTESGVMTDTVLAARTLAALKNAGFRLAIDDFGTGHSSLNYLHLFRVDRLKIDRSFVQRALTSMETGNIVRTIASLGRQLGLEVVAEGISDAATLERLRDMDCGYGQGMLFAPPLPPDRVPALLSGGVSGVWALRSNVIAGNAGLVA